MKNYNELKKFCLDNGAHLFGVADIQELKKDFHLPEEVSKDLNRGISLGVRLSGKILQTIKGEPNRLYYHHYRQTNILLDQLALKVAGFLQAKDAQALPIPASQIVDWEKQLGQLSHKLIGQEAGLGWIGRSNLLINSDFGAHFRLITILTDMDLPADKPPDIDCGTCRKCLAVCPANAIKETQKDFNHVSCYEKLKEFRKLGLTDQFICGICVKACNGNQSS